MKTKWFCPVMGLVLMALVTQAARLVPLSIQQLTDRARLVLHANVVKKTVQRDAAGRIYSRIDLRIIDTWKGHTTTSSFVAVQSGGVLGEEITTVDGQEELTPGEEVVLFLVLNKRDEGVVIGLSQGKFNVTQNAKGEKFAHNAFHGSTPAQARGTDSSGKDQSSALTLLQLKALVQGGRP